MTDPDKTYWIRSKGTIGLGRPHGLLATLRAAKHRDKLWWTQKPSLASAVAGGSGLDNFLSRNLHCEAVEIEKVGETRVRGMVVSKWRPVKINGEQTS